MMKKCAVIGSINTDMVARTPRFPAQGESIIGSVFRTEFGGKGANQAIALARLGAEVCMAGKIGDDLFGKKYLEHLIEEKVNVDCVAVETGETTGVADIWVADSGENSIISIPGANAKCDLDWLNAALERLSDCDIFLLQLEIPHETVGAALKKLREMGKTVILDPAPAVPLPAEWLACADYITPNETELEILTGDLPKNATVEARIRRLVGESNRMVIHKRGAEGAFIGTKDGVLPVSGFKVKAVDTTAAGDTFNAGLAAGLAMGKPIEECVRLANAAGALAVTALGAQGCMPTLEMIRERFGIE